MTHQTPAAWLQQLIESRNEAAFSATLAGLAASALLVLTPVLPNGISRLVGTSSGLAASAIFARSSARHQKLKQQAEDAGLVGEKQTLAWLNNAFRQLPNLSFAQTQSQPTPLELLPSLVDYWLKQDKHLLIVAPTGAGKSTVVRAIAAQVSGWAIKVYDVDYTVDDYKWLDKSAIVYDRASINESMANDLNVLEQRLEERRKQGDKWHTQPKLTIAEEMPALAKSCEAAPDWISEHARRGRKPKCYIAAIAQNDTVKNLALEGDSELKDCFVRVYLGKAAVKRAEQLKNTALVDWLKGASHGRMLVDDMPCEWNISNNTQTVTQQPQHSNSEYNYSSEAAEATGVLEVDWVEMASEAPEVPWNGHSGYSGSPTTPSQPSSYLPARTAEGIASDIRSTLQSYLSDYGWQLLRKLLPKNVIGCKSEVRLVYELVQLQKQGTSKSKSIQIVWGCKSGDKFTDASNLYEALAGSGVFHLTDCI